MSHQQYGKASYWDDRYTKDPEIFDWYQVGHDGMTHVPTTVQHMIVFMSEDAIVSCGLCEGGC